MAQADKTIEVSGTVLPATIAAGLRVILIVAMPLLVEKGIIPEGSTESAVAYVIAAATFAYGIYRTFTNKQKLIATAEAAPNSVAVVK